MTYPDCYLIDVLRQLLVICLAVLFFKVVAAWRAGPNYVITRNTMRLCDICLLLEVTLGTIGWLNWL